MLNLYRVITSSSTHVSRQSFSASIQDAQESQAIRLYNYHEDSGQPLFHGPALYLYSISVDQPTHQHSTLFGGMRTNKNPFSDSCRFQLHNSFIEEPVVRLGSTIYLAFVKWRKIIRSNYDGAAKAWLFFCKTAIVCVSYEQIFLPSAVSQRHKAVKPQTTSSMCSPPSQLLLSDLAQNLCLGSRAFHVSDHREFGTYYRSVLEISVISLIQAELSVNL